jgi:3-hydroxy-9,10-secoandrosta-1,3,5(10)-triene-9,17-dione monooxygenase reductase component
MTTFSEREFRDGLGTFATGVCIVTTEVDGLRLGATISSFNSVSLNPPLVLFSLARTILSFSLWSRAEQFAVTVLAEDQVELSNQFARGAADKWAGVPFLTGKFGCPLIQGGVASFECAKHASHDGGDHEIIVGRVLSFAASETVPLIFYKGRYGKLHPESNPRARTPNS